MQSERVYRGPLAAIDELLDLEDQHVLRGTPSNVWPRSQTWCTLTHWDLCCTFLAGPSSLLVPLSTHSEIDAIMVTYEDILGSQ